MTVAGSFGAAQTLVDSKPQGAEPWRTAPPTAPAAARLLVAAGSAVEREQLTASLDSEFAVHSVASAADAGRALRAGEIELLIVGTTLTDVRPERLAQVVSERQLCAVIIATDAPGWGPTPEGVFYRVGLDVAPQDLRAIASGALAHRAARSSPVPEQEPEARLQRAAQLQLLGESARKVALQRTARDAARVLAAAIPQLVDADRWAFLYYDADSGTLWSEAGDPADDYEGYARHGLVGFAARTGAGLAIGRAELDPRYRAELDNRYGAASDRLALEPVLGPDAQVHGVLVAARSQAGEPFSLQECGLLRDYATRCAPVLDALALQAEAQDLRSELVSQAAPSSYRSEALQVYHHRKLHGEVVRMAAGWTRVVYWMLAVFAISAASYGWFAQVNEYATGGAVVVAPGRTEVSAKLPGTLSSLAVEPGDAVHRGDVLARFYDASDAAELASLDEQFQRELVRRLRDLSDSAAERALRSLTSQRARTLSRLEERTLRAPVAGIVGDIRAHEGQLVAAGQLVLSISGPDSRVELLAAVPAGARSSLRQGMSVRISLLGHPGQYLDAPISSISDDAISVSTVRVAHGEGLASMLPPRGAVVLVRVELPVGPVLLDGKRVQLRHGMQAVADVRVRSERVITALIPGLRDAIGSSGSE